MNVNGIGSNSATQPTQAAASTTNNDPTQTFLTLLMTELKAQDPTSPMDPTQMVGQMVQFNTLGEIMKIRELMQAMPQAQTSSSTAAGSSTLVNS